MILWRVSNYANLDGAGGLYVSGRWHTKGHSIIYCSWNPATALLETLVHIEIDAQDRPERVQIMKIEASDSASLERIKTNNLPSGWWADWSVTQEAGDAWLAGRRTLLLEVPGVLAPETWNVLVNPLHPEASELKIIGVYEHPLDVRFFR